MTVAEAFRARGLDPRAALAAMTPEELREIDALLREEDRQEARSTLLGFTQHTFERYQVADVHRRIAEKLEAVERGQIKRLLVSLPPRGGKSELVSRRFPAWCIGRRPGMELITASYNSTLAEDMSRDVRGIVRSEEFRELFPECKLRADSAAMDRWETTTGCKYRAVGVEGAATGRGADGFIIDDPVKDRQEADSELRQKRTWDWYTSTAYTRLSKDGWVICCQTRWNESDLSGLLLENMAQGGETWHELVVPALDATGESFWPERFPLDRLAAIRNTLPARDWSALYMQRPQPDEGTFFQRNWFPRGDPLPNYLHRYITSDHARTQDGGDWTVIRVWGVDAKRDLWALGGWRGQATADIWAAEAIRLIREHKPLCWFPENDATWGSIAPFVKTQMQAAGVACRIEPLSTRGDKATKAQAFQGMAAQGRVHIPHGADFDAMIDEYLRFPGGKHDDEVDAAAHMGRALMEAHPAIVPSKPEEKKLDPWGRPVAGSFDWRAA